MICIPTFHNVAAWKYMQVRVHDNKEHVINGFNCFSRGERVKIWYPRVVKPGVLWEQKITHLPLKSWKSIWMCRSCLHYEVSVPTVR